MLAEFWTAYGFYLWLCTTILLFIALIWLGWNTFAADGENAEGQAVLLQLSTLEERIVKLEEATPHMQATLGRAMQFCGLERYTDPAGAHAFSLALVSARGDGFVLSSSVRGGISAKPVANWQSTLPLTAEEEAAIEQARSSLPV